MVARVRQRYQENREGTEALFDEIDQCLQEGLAALAEPDPPGLGGAMQRNHQRLKSLGVSCPQIEKMVGLAQEAGASGAKLTGAGGGGGVIAEASGCEDEVLEAWRSSGFDAWRVGFADGGGLVPMGTRRGNRSEGEFGGT
jgi:mevalonate kinase